jgi:uncharacterized protein YndB with AHSA1/START domain
MIMTATTPITPNGKATTVKTTFHRETGVSTNIHADAAIVWQLLTHAAGYPRWNTTIIAIEGTIALGEKIKLKSTLDPKRTFRLKVKEMETDKKLVWGDAQGNRIYTIAKNGNGSVNFSMVEKIGGFLFPLFAKMIPPFDQPFEQFAADLKKEAEKIMGKK